MASARMSVACVMTQCTLHILQQPVPTIRVRAGVSCTLIFAPLIRAEFLESIQLAWTVRISTVHTTFVCYSSTILDNIIDSELTTMNIIISIL